MTEIYGIVFVLSFFESKKERIFYEKIIHRADSRGHAYHGWLNTYHTFSFANYYDPNRIHFGALRVLNDDTIIGGEGFGTHPHDNMEVISIPLVGTLEHKDSMDNKAVIESGDIQVMSAGTGIYHSEYNKNYDRDVQFLQIWVFPDTKNVTPRYDQLSIREVAKRDELYQILSPSADDQGVWIHQQAWFHLGDLSEGWKGTYRLKGGADSGVYLFVIEGGIQAGGELLRRRDGIGISESGEVEIEATAPNTKLLVMEVPMKFSE